MGSRKNIVPVVMTRACITQTSTTFPTTSPALSIFFCPRKIDETVAPPTAISTQNATTRFIKGKVMARPVIAIAPTPLPIKILSTMLYNEVARLAIIAGREYCTSNLPILLVPRLLGDVFTELLVVSTLVETLKCEESSIKKPHRI